jgi:hypothetical protein
VAALAEDGGASVTLDRIADALSDIIREAAEEELLDVLGTLEALKGAAWARLLRRQVEAASTGGGEQWRSPGAHQDRSGPTPFQRRTP